jgi:hypothetical protein
MNRNVQELFGVFVQNSIEQQKATHQLQKAQLEFGKRMISMIEVMHARLALIETHLVEQVQCSKQPKPFKESKQREDITLIVKETEYFERLLSKLMYAGENTEHSYLWAVPVKTSDGFVMAINVGALKYWFGRLAERKMRLQQERNPLIQVKAIHRFLLDLSMRKSCVVPDTLPDYCCRFFSFFMRSVGKTSFQPEAAKRKRTQEVQRNVYFVDPDVLVEILENPKHAGLKLDRDHDHLHVGRRQMKREEGSWDAGIKGLLHPTVEDYKQDLSNLSGDSYKCRIPYPCPREFFMDPHLGWLQFHQHRLFELVLPLMERRQEIIQQWGAKHVRWEWTTGDATTPYSELVQRILTSGESLFIKQEV